MQEVFENLSEAEKSLMKELEAIDSAIEKSAASAKIEWAAEAYARLNVDNIENGVVLEKYDEIGNKLKQWGFNDRGQAPATEAAA